MRFLCRIGWHDWQNWVTQTMWKTPNYYGVSFPEDEYEVTVQVTHCKHYNKRKIKEL